MNTLLQELDALLDTQGRLQFAKGNYNEADAEAYGFRLLEFIRLRGVELRATIAAPKEAGADWIAGYMQGANDFTPSACDQSLLREDAAAAFAHASNTAAPQADQQGASLEGDDPVDGVFRTMPDDATFEDYLLQLARGKLTAVDQVAFDNVLHDYLAALSKASPDDQRQEGAIPAVPYAQHEREVMAVLRERDSNEEAANELAALIAAMTGEDIGEHSSANNPWAMAKFAAEEWLERKAASPPTEAAAAVGELQKMAANLENSQQQCDEDGCMIQVSRQALVETLALIAALSPTASAAREGSDA